MTTTTPHLTEWQARAATYGYARVSDERCPRRLVGKRHRGLSCWCVTPLNDHAATWSRHGHTVVLWEPYAARPEVLADVARAAAEDALRASVHGHSPWNPGATIAVEFTPAEAS